jgi:hypothetical protein
VGEEAARREALVTAEGPHEARGTGVDAEEREGEDRDDPAKHGSRCFLGSSGFLEDHQDGEWSRENGVCIGDAVQDGDDVGEAGKAVNYDCADHGSWDVDWRIVCFFGHMYDGVDTS